MTTADWPNAVVTHSMFVMRYGHSSRISAILVYVAEVDLNEFSAALRSIAAPLGTLSVLQDVRLSISGVVVDVVVDVVLSGVD